MHACWGCMSWAQCSVCTFATLGSSLRPNTGGASVPSSLPSYAGEGKRLPNASGVAYEAPSASTQMGPSTWEGRSHTSSNTLAQRWAELGDSSPSPSSMAAWSSPTGADAARREPRPLAPRPLPVQARERARAAAEAAARQAQRRSEAKAAERQAQRRSEATATAARHAQRRSELKAAPRVVQVCGVGFKCTSIKNWSELKAASRVVQVRAYAHSLQSSIL